MAEGVPEILPTAERLIPAGRLPEVREKVGEGYPVAVRLKLLAIPVVIVIELVPVKSGAWFTINVNDWMASVPTPLLAFTVKK